jgi:hypothetical protein
MLPTKFELFAHFPSVDVVSHISSDLSRGFSSNFLRSQKITVPLLQALQIRHFCSRIVKSAKQTCKLCTLGERVDPGGTTLPWCI